MTAHKKSPALANPWPERLRSLESRKDALVKTIRELVEIESPSDNKTCLRPHRTLSREEV